jgi:hypothetical protein
VNGGRQSHSLPQAANGRFATLISEVPLAGFGPKPDPFPPPRTPERLGAVPRPSNSGQPFHHWDLAETIVPTCSAGPEDMSIGFESDIAIQAPGGHDQPRTVRLHVRKRRPARRAKAFTVSRRWQREAPELVLPRDPS